MKKEDLVNKCITVKNEEECNRVQEFLESLGIVNSDGDNYNDIVKKGYYPNLNVTIFITDSGKNNRLEYVVFVEDRDLKNGVYTKLEIEDLFNKDLKEKLIELFNNPETIIRLRSKEEALKLDKLYRVIEFEDYINASLVKDQNKNIMYDWYSEKYKCHTLYIKDMIKCDDTDPNFKNAITFDDLIDYVKERD